jgi:hypothetical protein
MWPALIAEVIFLSRVSRFVTQVELGFLFISDGNPFRMVSPFEVLVVSVYQALQPTVYYYRLL